MTFQDICDQARLALACYANGLLPGSISDNIASFAKEGWSSAQSSQFSAAGWTVVDQFVGASGASATIFQDASGDRHLAVRGTEITSGRDLLADAFLWVGVPAQANVQFIDLQIQVGKWINGYDTDSGHVEPLLPELFTVTGHSLGGYLATALKSTFSEISEAFLFNSPGVAGLAGDLAEFFESAFGVSPPSANGLWNVIAESGPTLIPRAGSFASVPIYVPTEGAVGAVGDHSMVRVLDGLEVLSVTADLIGLSDFTPANVATLSKMFDAAGVGLGVAPDELLNAVRRVLGLTNVATSGIDDVSSTARQVLYSDIASTIASPQYQALKGQTTLLDLSGMTADQLASLASQDTSQGAAVRKALDVLSPFALTGTQGSSYSDRDPAYWSARADMLERLNWFFTADQKSYDPSPKNMEDLINNGHPFQWEDRTYTDQTTALKIQQGTLTGANQEILFGKETGDTFTVTKGRGLVFAGGGNDTITGGAGADVLYGESGNDNLYGKDGDDILYGGAGDDNLMGDAGADLLYGGDGADKLYGGAGKDELHGDAGNDSLYGDAGDDVLVGGLGNDILVGGEGSDTYLYARGDGQDVISDLVVGTDQNVLKISGYRTGEAQFSCTATGQLKIQFPDEDAILVHNWFKNEGYRLYEIQFDDRTMTASELTELSAVIYSAPNPYSYQAYAFDGANFKLVGSANVDLMVGAGGDDILEGFAGNDTLRGGAGNDQLFGGEGDDILEGDAGDDLLEGGAGNDTLRGGQGSDTYVYRVGDGNDKIFKVAEAGAENKIVVQGMNYDPTKLTITTNKELLIQVGSGSITVAEFFTSYANGTANISSVSFNGVEVSAEHLWDVARKVYSTQNSVGNYVAKAPDGVAVTLIGTQFDRSEHLAGGSGDTLFVGGGGQNAISAGEGNDVIVYESGYTTIHDRGGVDTLDFGVRTIQEADFSSPYTITFSYSNRIRLDNPAGADTANGRGVEFFKFADGVLTWEQIKAKFAEAAEKKAQASAIVTTNSLFGEALHNLVASVEALPIDLSGVQDFLYGVGGYEFGHDGGHIDSDHIPDLAAAMESAAGYADSMASIVVRALPDLIQDIPQTKPLLAA